MCVLSCRQQTCSQAVAFCLGTSEVIITTMTIARDGLYFGLNFDDLHCLYRLGLMVAPKGNL